MAKSDIRIDLLGTSFLLTVEEEPVYLQTLLGRYRTIIENTQKITGIQDPLKIAILAGIQLCDDLEKLRTHELSGERVLEATAAENTVISLIERIDKALLRCL
ncbi:MAG: cell division protein ZapA [Spirochaetaceae bacterium]|jgi:cell division protein ZapA (FtsZ GTPase activity inhibitor)|nr:cell division protein ZapA [Spirochaetaceae bacterium]